MDRLGLLADPAVRSAFGREIGRAIEYHSSIGSTQDRARELARTGVAVPTLVVADQQAAGHGRGEKSWLSEPGAALLASWIFRPAPAEPGLFTLLAGVAVTKALRPFGVADLGLKWPNDVWLTNGKIAGCLAHGASDHLVIGIGVNVSQRELPREIANVATTLVRAGHDIDRLTLLARITTELDAVADRANRDAALAEWRKRSITLNREVEVSDAGSAPFRGKAIALADDGALVVETPYGQQRVIAGEVRVLG
ncbi:MAG TPA: biotin--[acetyl-CoA-carboxylase] ligase [Candidatus Limnocylindria bacterium]|nr:biotin--[acetyl-CoA-carboxylase] ligase [Candidatus Limnocylindria bacterium]